MPLGTLSAEQRAAIRQDNKYGLLMGAVLGATAAVTPIGWIPWWKGSKRSTIILAAAVAGFVGWPAAMRLTEPLWNPFHQWKKQP